MCPFKKAFPFVLLMHLLFAVGIIGAFAEKKLGNVFTLVQAVGIGEELKPGVDDSIAEDIPAIAEPSHTITPVIELDKVAAPKPAAPTPKSEEITSKTEEVRKATTSLPSLGSVAGNQNAEAPQMGGAIATQGIGNKITPPIALRKPKPTRPEGIAKGQVVLIFTINKKGTVENVSIEGTPSPQMANAVLAILPKWRFAPAKENGKAIDLRVRQVVEF